MSWRVIAKRDALDPLRSRSLWVLVALFVLLFGAATYLQTAREISLAALLVSTVYMFVPITSLMLGYQAVAKSRQNGGLRVVLAYPHTRREVVLGTAVGRALVATVLVSVGFLAAAVVYLVEVGVPDLGAYAIAWGLALLLAASMAGFAVGVSASVRTTNRAVMLCFGAFLSFLVLWRQLPGLLRYVLNGFAAPRGPRPEWAAVFTQLNPVTAYRTTISGLLSGQPASPSAFYTSEWFGVLVLVGWLLVPLLVGVWRFSRNDL